MIVICLEHPVIPGNRLPEESSDWAIMVKADYTLADSLNEVSGVYGTGPPW